MAVIYIDRVFLLNMLVDYLLLVATARLAGRGIYRGKFIFCAAWGGIYASAVFYLPILSQPLVKLLSGVILAGIAFWQECHRLRMMALFFLLSAGLAGVLLGLGYLSGSPAAYLQQFTSAQINWQTLLGATIAFRVLLHIFFRQGGRHGGGELLKVELCLQGKRKETYALHDTGNTLRNPINGEPVLILEQAVIESMVPEQVWETLRLTVTPEEKMAHLAESGYRFMLLPFCTVGTPSGFLLAIRSDYICVEGKQYRRAWIALSEGTVSDGGGYQALWGEGRKKRRATADTAAQLDQKAYQVG